MLLASWTISWWVGLVVPDRQQPLGHFHLDLTCQSVGCSRQGLGLETGRPRSRVECVVKMVVLTL